MTMPVLIEYNQDAEGRENSREFIGYLQEQRINKVGSDYRVASGLTRGDAVIRLCDLAGDMLTAFDVMPSGVDPKQKDRLEFANQFGIFYVDQLRD